MGSTKVLYCISDIDKALSFEWIVEKLDHNKITLVFILINSKVDSPLINFLISRNITTYNLEIKSNLNYFKCIYSAYQIFKIEKIKVIHCHLFKANIVGLIASFFARVPKRIYTRHHSDYNYTYSKKGIWVDKINNYLATKIIAISKPVEEILIDWEKVPKSKVELIHHGFDMDYFKKYNPEILKSLKQKYNPENQSPIIGVIARFTEYKGIQYIIPAFKKLLLDFPNAKLLLFNAKGDYEVRINAILKDIPVENYQLVAFENNLAEVYRLFDCYVHVPHSYYSEAFGQTYVEALISGVPSVFTLSGIATEIVKPNVNAIVVDYKNSEQIYLAMKTLAINEQIKIKLINYSNNEYYIKFNLEKFINKLQELYLR